MGSPADGAALFVHDAGGECNFVPEQAEELLEVLSERLGLKDDGPTPQGPGMDGDVVAINIDRRRAAEVIARQPAVAVGVIEKARIALTDEDARRSTSRC